MSDKVLFVEYCAKDFLDGTYNMDVITELAYRRICDLILSTNDKLLDNDTLQYSTKTGSKWKTIKKELIEVHQVIFIEDGFIRNKKCTEKLAKSERNIEQKREAGKASSEKRNSLKNNDTTSTAVETDVTTDVPTNQKPNNQYKKEKNNKKKKMEKPDDVTQTTWDEFVDLRKQKRALITAAVLSRIRKEASKINWTLEQALQEMVFRNWQGFNAEWVNNTKGQDHGKSKSDIADEATARAMARIDAMEAAEPEDNPGAGQAELRYLQ